MTEECLLFIILFRQLLLICRNASAGTEAHTIR